MLRKITIISAALAALVGCGSGDHNEEARLRVFHASPDAPAVDVLVDGGSVLGAVPYTAASEFLTVSPGLRQITVNVAGTNTAVIDAEVELDADTDYLVIAAGKVDSIAPIVATADRSGPASGSARVRVLHSAASAPEVDVYVVAPGANIETTQPVLADVPFRAISNYLTVPAGNYDVKVTVANTKTVAIQALNLVLADGLVATVAALDKTGGGSPFSLLVLDER
jgi:hypothetical protein